MYSQCSVYVALSVCSLVRTIVSCKGLYVHLSVLSVLCVLCVVCVCSLVRTLVPCKGLYVLLGVLSVLLRELLHGCSYLVDPASSHMLVSKIKPCMCKYQH